MKLAPLLLVVAATTAGLAACGDDASPAVAPASDPPGSQLRTATAAGPATAPASHDVLARNRADAGRFVGYANAGALDADIRRYALARS